MKLSKSKIKKYEVYLKKSLEALRKIGRELSSQSNKVAKKASQNNTSNDNPMKLDEFEMYKESVDILGMSMDELEDFVNPSQTTAGKSKEDQNFISKLDKAVEIPETLNQDLELICSHCVKLIHDINPLV